jgi:hypothetical protein
MTQRRSLTQEESAALLRHAEQIEHIRKQPAGPMRANSSCNAFLNRGHIETAFEIKKPLRSLTALANLQHPLTTAPVEITPELCAARQALIEELAAKVGPKRRPPQVTRGRGATVDWADSTLLKHVRKALQQKKKERKLK